MSSSTSSLYQLDLPKGWVDTVSLTRALRTAGDPHNLSIEAVDITLPCGCKVLVDAGTQLLSLINQLATSGRQVTLRFEEGREGVMGYLYRLAFFDLLHPEVQTVPPRPTTSAIEMAGTNPGLVEFKGIHPGSRDRRTPTLLADALEAAFLDRADREALGAAAFTLLGEMIDNIYQHSNTPIDGYAALQVYRRGGNVLVAVSDSGDGLIETLRPSLQGSNLESLPDTELIVKMLNDGLSRWGRESPERGAGLCQCTAHALKYSAQLKLRLATSSLTIMPGTRASQSYDGTVHCQEGLPRLYGTHLAFRFHLSA